MRSAGCEIIISMSEIQFKNKYPDELAIPNLYAGMNERVPTPNGNVLSVRTNTSGVGIFDPRLLAGEYPMYMFAAFIERPGLLRVIARSRAPGDWPHRKHPDIRPTEQMEQTIGYLDVVGNPVTTFRTNWTVDDTLNNTNALIFRQYMNDLSHRGLDEAERQRAAVLHTPTGKMMTRLGFVLDIESITDHRGVIEVDFSRGEAI